MAFNMSGGTTCPNNINVDSLDDSENNAKISDSGYSNSCSNSQARSRSSQSTHSGSHSSGSSGYGGQPSTSGYSSNNVSQLPSEIRCKIKKKKKQLESETSGIKEEHPVPPDPEPEVKPAEEVCTDVVASPAPAELQCVDVKDISTLDRCSVTDKTSNCNFPLNSPNQSITNLTDGFSCVISMQDGIVMYATSSLTNTLGYPKCLWIGRSFLDFVHPRDRNTFASQITNGLATPKTANGTPKKGSIVSTMVCRIRRYRGLTSGFGIKDRLIKYSPFLLKLSFRNICDEDGEVVYLLLQAKPFFSAFKTPNEKVSKPVPFVIRHAANGEIKHIDAESVPYLGYSPQDIINKDALLLYHPHDLAYLCQVYESIVKEGGVPRSKPYRMKAQNGDYVKLETEWSSFINPWSRKLEFVIGKHSLIEGPTNPDVFQSAQIDKSVRFSEDDRIIAHQLRKTIERIMNEVLTKPAEAAKQQMTKRCQELASFMESLMEEVPKTDDTETWLDIQEPEIGNYERDSVMLGGISPHHDCNDSKCSTESQISYNQLNYNETLQRYFRSHLAYSEENNSYSSRPVHRNKSKSSSSGKCLSPMTQNSGDSCELSSSSESSPLLMSNCSHISGLGEYQPVRLTESALTKHNAAMEKELVKLHKEIKSSNKDERKKSSKESRQKKKEHLARCNASFLPTSAGLSTVHSQSRSGSKRSSKHAGGSGPGQKYRYSSGKFPRRKSIAASARAAHSSHKTNVTPPTPPTSQTPPRPMNTPTPMNASTPMNPVNNMNAFFVGVTIPQHMALISPVPAIPGMIPICYVPATPQRMPTAAEMNNQTSNNVNQVYPMPYMVYGQPLYGSPIMYSPISAHVQYPMQQGYVAQGVGTNLHPLGLSHGNYQESAKAATEFRNKRRQRHSHSDGTLDRTDEESSYSSFYSNFFKSESGSAEESDSKKHPVHAFYDTDPPKRVPKRKMEPPWMEQVCLTPDLINKYQITPKNIDEVLSCDKKRLASFDQPGLVNDQLDQLYLDMQLEGVASRLTLEEGVTSSSSSGEENFSSKLKAKSRRRKRDYSRLVMIYEEDAPLPSPDDEPGSSTS